MDAAKLKELRLFVEQCKANPAVLSDPAIAFFRDYLESLGAKLPAAAYSTGASPRSYDTSKWLVAALYGLAILWKRDAEVLWAAIGSIINSWLSITLKMILNHERPVSGLRFDLGMSSSHAQSIFYVKAFAIFSSKL